MSERRRDSVRALNGGHRRRVEIARALLHEPRLLLLDEASAGLDPASRLALNRHIRQLCQEQRLSVLWTTHLLDEVQADDQLLILHQGRLVASGVAGTISQQQGGDLGTAFARLTQNPQPRPAPIRRTARMNAYWQCLRGIVLREWLRFVLQRTRFLSALVRPLLWLLVFAAGFRAALGIAIIEPYSTYIPYEVYIVPGLACMILLFNGMQGSLSMVYDREMGSMRVLLTSPLPRAFLLASKLLATSLISLLQVYAFLAVAWLYGVQPPAMGLLAALPALLLVALMLSALGLLLSNAIRQLENFAGVMNFVIFPLFFLSSALYPLWKMLEASPWLYWLCALNPFTHAVELVRFALYQRLNLLALAVCLGLTLVFSLLAVLTFNPQPRRPAQST